MVPPIALSLAASIGWTQPLLVIGLVAVLEVVTANFAEPLLFGQSIGVFAIVAYSIMIAAALALPETKGRELTADRTELEDARCFSRVEVAAALAGDPDAPFLPPPKVAIARTLLEHWLAA